VSAVTHRVDTVVPRSIRCMSALAGFISRLRRSWRLLLKELGAFGVVGGVCLMIDLGVFQLLYANTGTGPLLAKLASTVVATTVAYFAQRHWAFGHRARTGLRREYTLFFVVNGVTLLLGLLIVAVVHGPLGYHDALVLQLANIGSIGLGTVIRYVCYRKWVFVGQNDPAAIAHRLYLDRRTVAQQTEQAAA
jgi:putative flippase GtrA